MKTILFKSALILSLVATPALAGSKRMNGPAGEKLSISCSGSECKVREKAPGKSWKTVEKGPGGTENYEKTVAAYQAKGYK